MSSSEKIFAFVAGAAAGAVAALLLAPEKGDVTREKISRQADQLLNDLEGQWETSYSKIRDLANSALEEAERMGGSAEKKMDNKMDNNA